VANRAAITRMSWHHVSKDARLVNAGPRAMPILRRCRWDDSLFADAQGVCGTWRPKVRTLPIRAAGWGIPDPMCSRRKSSLVTRSRRRPAWPAC